MSEMPPEENKLRTELLSLLIHDARNLLLGVMGPLEILDMEGALAENHEFSRYLASARSKCNEMGTILRNLAAVAQMEEGKIYIRCSPVNIQELIQARIQPWEKQARECNIEARVSYGEDLPSLECDAEITSWAVDCLLANALSFNPSPGRVQVSVTHEKESDSIKVCVVNENPTLPIAYEKGLLEDSSSILAGQDAQAYRRKKIGLRLFFCRLAAQAHNGKLCLESEPGGPVRFIFMLPASKAKG